MMCKNTSYYLGKIKINQFIMVVYIYSLNITPYNIYSNIINKGGFNNMNFTYNYVNKFYIK